jgi:hypothetical protein
MFSIIYLLELSTVSNTKNPLTAFMRRPKVFLRLPSQGRYWPDGAIDISDTNEYAVYAMTVKDELLLKTPDALLNGYGTVSVIQSCIPAIKDAWQIPSIDLDAILMALRIASYGEKVEVDIQIPESSETEPFEIDLRPMLDSVIDNIVWDPMIKINDDITVHIKPINYKDLTQANIMNFEGERILRQMLEPNTPEETKIQLMNQAAERLAEANVIQVVNGIERIDTSEGSTDDKEHITEFLKNSDPTVFKAVNKRFKELNEKNNYSEITVQTPPKYVEQGAPETITTKFELDYSSFFA